MRQIILHAPKAIARDPGQPGKLIFTDSGTVLPTNSPGLNAKVVGRWLKDGSAALHRPA